MSSRDMMANDRASAALGMVVETDEPGRAVVSMRVRDDMTNGFGITHGGLVFALADTAFAIACNEDDRVTVSVGAEIDFVRSTRQRRAAARHRRAPRAPGPARRLRRHGHRRGGRGGRPVPRPGGRHRSPGAAVVAGGCRDAAATARAP